MIFRDVAVKNFRANIRWYLSYFLCSSFSVMIFFMYSTIFLNEKLRGSKQVAKDAMDGLVVPTAVLVIFSIIFISYAHSSFIKSRQREFGLFMSLGMSTKQIVRIIFLENGLVALASLLTGIASGAVFSRIFFIVVLKVLEVSGIEFSIPYKSFPLTLGVFAAIFLLAILSSVVTACRFQPVQLLKSSKASQRNKVSNPVLAMIGISIMAASIIYLCAGFAKQEGMESRTLLLLTVLCLTGLYITISQLGGLLLRLSRKRKALYYRNLRLITGLDYRFKQTKKIIFAAAIMVMATTFYCGIMFYMLSTAEKTALGNNPFHAAYIQLSDKNNIPEAQLNNILSDGETELTQHRVLEVIKPMWIYHNAELGSRNVISVDKLNEIAGGSLKVEKGHYILLNQIPDISNSEENQPSMREVELKSGGRTTSFKLQEEVNKIYFNRLKNFWADIILLNNEDYLALKNRANSIGIENIHLLNFKDWRKTEPILSRLYEAFKAYNETTPRNVFAAKNGQREEEFFSVVSRMGDYTSQRQSSSMLLFISGFLGLFFFISASVILSFKLFSEIDDEKAKYRKLSNIGIRDKEIKGTINKELGLIFFIPVILGAGLSLLYIYAFTHDGGQNTAPMIYNLLISSLYLVFQIIYYYAVRRVYSNRIIESLSVQ